MIQLLLLLVAVTLVLFIVLKIFKKLFLIFFVLMMAFGLYTYFGWSAIRQGTLPYPGPLRSLGAALFPGANTEAGT